MIALIPIICCSRANKQPIMSTGLNHTDFNTVQVLSEMSIISFISSISLSISFCLRVIPITLRADFSLLCSSSHLGLSGMKRSEEHTSELQSRFDLVCRLLLEKKKKKQTTN